MEGAEQGLEEQADPKKEQQIRLEEARKARIDAEAKKKRQESRRQVRKNAAGSFKKLPKKVKVVGSIVVAAVLIFACGVLVPLALDRDETQYLTETSLKDAVDIESLAAIDYTYKGIAEKAGKFLWADTVDYRVKYEAHVRASYNMTEIEFTLDEGNMVVTAYLPDAQIGTPVLDENEFGYLPENATADMRDILALCKEDAANDLDQEEIKKEANASLQDIVEALTMPLLGDEWTIEFKSLAEYPSEVEVPNEGE